MKSFHVALVLFVLAVIFGTVPASAQELYDDEETPVEFSAIGMMSTEALWTVKDLRPEAEKRFSIFATGKYKIGFSLQKGRWMATVYRFRDNVPVSYTAVIDPTQVHQYWGWEGEGFFILKQGEHFDFGPVFGGGVGWYQGKDHLFSGSLGVRAQYGPGVFDLVWDTNSRGASLRFGLRLR